MIIVTGGSGKVGRAVLADLAAHGYKTASIDTARPTTGIALQPNESLKSIEKARKVLGYAPQFDWQG